ncbi:MAG: ABC transporter substrate-binding protein [Propionibacteriaceae bacterium]|jgi:polar amino acid transport system substrate-binding protein|nr:ABC transporter substrate-binding protein [Propionibacteriaceae bacterium]
MNLRITKGLAVAAAATMLFTACSSDDTKTDPSASSTATTGKPAGYTIKDGTLTACGEVPFAPFEYEDPTVEGGYTGFDLDLGHEIAARLGLDYEFITVDFNALQSGMVLVAGQCDVGTSAISITPERAANIDFSEGYYTSLLALLVSKESGITGVAGMSDKVIGVQLGSTGEAYANENAPADATIVTFEGDGDLWLALQAGTIDGVLQDQPVNVLHVRADANYILAEEYDTGEEYGFAYAKGQHLELQADIAQTLKDMRADGTYQTFYDKYFK